MDDKESHEQFLTRHQAGQGGRDDEESFNNAELNAVELLVGDQLSRKELNDLKALQVCINPNPAGQILNGTISIPCNDKWQGIS